MLNDYSRAYIRLASVRDAVARFFFDHAQYIVLDEVFSDTYERDVDAPTVMSGLADDFDEMREHLEEFGYSSLTCEFDHCDILYDNIHRFAYEVAFMAMACHYESMPEWTKNSFYAFAERLLDIPEVEDELWRELCDVVKKDEHDYRLSLTFDDIRVFYDDLIRTTKECMRVAMSTNAYAAVDINHDGNYAHMGVIIGDDVRHILFDRQFNGGRSEEWVTINGRNAN